MINFNLDSSITAKVISDKEVEFEGKRWKKPRAQYGKTLIENLAAVLNAESGSDFTARKLWNYR